MKICPRCGAENRDHSPVCAECGISLPAPTQRLKEEKLEPRPEHLPRPRVQLLFRGHHDPLILDIKQTALLGREGGEDGQSTLVNLDEYGAVSKGVSRQHALLSWDDIYLVIADLNSVNGTFVNGYRLKDNREYPLREDDEIKLGNLVCKVSFVENS